MLDHNGTIVSGVSGGINETKNNFKRTIEVLPAGVTIARHLLRGEYTLATIALLKSEDSSLDAEIALLAGSTATVSQVLDLCMSSTGSTGGSSGSEYSGGARGRSGYSLGLLRAILRLAGPDKVLMGSVITTTTTSNTSTNTTATKAGNTGVVGRDGDGDGDRVRVRVVEQEETDMAETEEVEELVGRAIKQAVPFGVRMQGSARIERLPYLFLNKEEIKR